MTRLTARSSISVLLAAFAIACCAVVAHSQRTNQKLGTAILVDAPVVPQMVVDSDGTLHFGPRTIPLPALASPEARQEYTRRMLQRAQASAGRGGLASVRAGETSPAPSDRPRPSSPRTGSRISLWQQEQSPPFPKRGTSLRLQMTTWRRPPPRRMPKQQQILLM
jgi:hypothetical protein